MKGLILEAVDRTITLIPISNADRKMLLDESEIMDDKLFIRWKENLQSFLVQTGIHDKFKLIKLLGQGSFGSVILAERSEPLYTLRKSMKSLSS